LLKLKEVAKCCNKLIGTFCTLTGITVWGFATLENGVQTIKYFDKDGTEYLLADIEEMNCPPANPFSVAFTFNNDFICDTNFMTGTCLVTLSATGGILDNTIFELAFSEPNSVIISSDPNIVVDVDLVPSFRVVDAGALTNPIVLQATIWNRECDPKSVTGVVDTISPLLHGWVLTTSTPDTLNYV